MYKKTAVLLTLLLAFFSIKICFALEQNLSRFELTSEISAISYKEPGVMKQSGMMQGVSAAYTYLDNIMIDLQGRLASGKVDYQSVNTGKMDDIDDFLAEFRALLGFVAADNDDYVVVPYLGIGYRYLEDDSQGRVTTTGHLGYRREANYYYCPIGVKITTDIGDGFVLGLFLEYDYFLEGRQKSYLSGAISGYNDLENKQSDGYGYRAGLKLRKDTADFAIIFEPYIRYWKIERSESSDLVYSGVIIGYGYEPKNYSTEYGFRFGLLF